MMAMTVVSFNKGMGYITENRENKISTFHAIYTRTAKTESESRLLGFILPSFEIFLKFQIFLE